MATDKLLIQQDLLATKLAFVVPTPCPYDETQGIATQLAFAYNKVKKAKARDKRIDTLNPAYEVLQSLEALEETYKSLTQHELVVQA
ncbi:hypothetical protein C2G38_2164679 [Gigaspora rosea]|uniref:Uncharacterized protein n=1 Tax=Gigaspora rosea TaxID=44941 RepID=A0A397VVH8_9GLOM|nr:hypothetical protein C2G38_2164679 [Gigaspora rosea]